MCVVLPISQAFAIKGGPTYGNGGVDVTGNYAGVFFPIFDATVGNTDDSLALFTLSIPRSAGLAQGSAVIFRKGFFYSGTITGAADPDSAKLSGIIQGTFTDTFESGSTAVSCNFTAAGKFENTQIVANTDIFSSAATRIRGKATITYNPPADPICSEDPNGNGDSGGAISYKVSGFKQSAATQ